MLKTRSAGTKALIAAMLVPAAIATYAGSAAAHVAAFDSKVSIKTDGGKLVGAVTSDKPRCERNRDVAVFLVEDGKDSKVDDASFNDGEWSLKVGDLTGDVYAKVTKRVFGGYGHQHTCSADKSRVISL